MGAKRDVRGKWSRDLDELSAFGLTTMAGTGTGTDTM